MAKMKDVYQIKVTLKHSQPPIWRKIQVPGDTRLDQLHLILQETMGWDNYHLHQFIVGGTYYGEPDPDFASFGPPMQDEKKMTVSQIVPDENFTFLYEYDFGDGWEHLLLVEKIFPPEEGVRYPRCIQGQRACPPEDVGGVWGYQGFLEAIDNSEHPQHEEMVAWVGGEFDPEEFDREEVNEGLHRLR